jgi:adenylyl-sulfate kinase
MAQRDVDPPGKGEFRRIGEVTGRGLLMAGGSKSPPPLFVLAPARSGSSVVAAMLGQHPQLYGFPELRLFRGATVSDLLVDAPSTAGMPARERNAGLIRALAQLHEHEQSEEAAERALQWLRERADWDVGAVFEHLSALIAPLAAVEKSPETSLGDNALKQAARACPEARYLHLVRHPWATVRSMVNAWSELEYWHVEPEEAPSFCLNVWREQHQRILAFGASAGPRRFARARAEDVVNHPEDSLPRLCHWLGIDAGAECIARMLHPERSPYAGPGPRNASGGFDPKFHTRPALRRLALPESLKPPPEWAIDGRAVQAAIELARQLGYEDEVGGTWQDAELSVPAARPVRTHRFVRQGSAGEAAIAAPAPGRQPYTLYGRPIWRGGWRHPEATAAVPLGATALFTGLPGAGKTCVAREVARLLFNAGRAVIVLDGDELRQGPSADLGFTEADRNEQVRRAIELALPHAASGAAALVALVSPYRRAREDAKARHLAAGVQFFEIHVDTPLEECERRDPKGLYRRARAGWANNVTGVDDPYEAPVNPDLRLTPEDGDIRAQAEIVFRLLALNFSPGK